MLFQQCVLTGLQVAHHRAMAFRVPFWDPRAVCRALILLSMIGSAGCGASATFDGTRFHKSEVDYRVGQLGADWHAVRIKGYDLAFHRAMHGAMCVTPLP